MKNRIRIAVELIAACGLLSSSMAGAIFYKNGYPGVTTGPTIGVNDKGMYTATPFYPADLGTQGYIAIVWTGALTAMPATFGCMTNVVTMSSSADTRLLNANNAMINDDGGYRWGCGGKVTTVSGNRLMAKIDYYPGSTKLPFNMTFGAQMGPGSMAVTWNTDY